MTGVGMIGCGYWGPNLLRNFVKNRRADVRVVADGSPERRAFVEETYPGLATVDGHRAVLEDPEVKAVVIATPAETHAALALEALEAGKHIMVEKPLAMSVKEAEAIVASAEAKGLKVLTGHTFLYNPVVKKLKALVDEDALGEVYYLYSQRLNLGIVRQDVNALWNLAPHDISIALHLFDESPVAVSASGACYLQEGIEDVVFMQMHFSSGRVAHVHVSWLDPGKVRRMTLVGSKKMAVYDDMAEDKLAVFDKGIDRHPTEAQRSPVKQPTEFGLHRLVTRAGEVVLPKIDFTEPLAGEVEHFLACIEEDRTPLTDGKAGLEVVRVLETATRSLEQGGGRVEI